MNIPLRNAMQELNRLLEKSDGITEDIKKKVYSLHYEKEAVKNSESIIGGFNHELGRLDENIQSQELIIHQLMKEGGVH